ncbi:DUF6891 domain-containing protein [Catellatospora vulcania]|uniref:DUF6891 domain-containing protein n=1 Tax=Catellatospora vulcania TaxID=1460450 RepID=UPI0012D4A038|nr:hypothetical protein [Catellatospora vulcania]
MQSEQVRRIASDNVNKLVARGDRACAAIVEDTVECLEGEADPAALQALAWELVGPAFAAHLDAQQTWPARTDSDRLTDAFRALDAAGIVAREDFACCQNCGVAEIGDEVLDAMPARGYVFYHQQDAERCAEGGGLYLAYGPLGQPPTAEIGEEVAAALRAEGLQVDWSGSAGQRIHVRVGWARRRHGRMAAYAPYDPAEPEVAVQVTKGRLNLPPTMTATALALLELPWLPADVTVRVEQNGRSVELRRERSRLVSDDGRSVGRFDGLRLLRGGDDPQTPDEPGQLEVTFESMPSGPRAFPAVPMVLPEVLDTLRRLPTRTNSWLCAVSASESVVQMRREQGGLWLETPHPEDATSTGKYATLDEAVQVLTILAAENRSAVPDLPGVTRQPW